MEALKCSVGLQWIRRLQRLLSFWIFLRTTRLVQSRTFSSLPVDNSSPSPGRPPFEWRTPHPLPLNDYVEFGPYAPESLLNLDKSLSGCNISLIRLSLDSQGIC